MICFDRSAGMLVMRLVTCFAILSYLLVQRLGRLVFIFQHLYSLCNVNTLSKDAGHENKDSHQLENVVLMNHQVLRMNIKRNVR